MTLLDSPAHRRTRWLIAAIYIPFGVLHVVHRHAFLAIMPPLVPWPIAVIVFTGLCEIAGGVGLLVPRLALQPLFIVAPLWASGVWTRPFHPGNKAA